MNGDDLPLPLVPLLDAVLGVGSDLELHATLQHIVQSAAELTGARYGALGVIDPGHGKLTDLFTAGLTQAERDRIGPLPDGHSGLLGTLIREPRPLLLDDLTTDPRSCGVPPGHPEMHSFLGVPVHVHDEAFGNLYLTEKREGRFTDEDLQLLRILASQAGIAIGNARLYEAARQRERWIDGAAAVTTALLTGEPAADALMTVAEQARILANASAGVILQPTEQGGMRIVAAATEEEAAEPASGTPAHPHDLQDDLIGTTIEPGSAVLEQLLGGEPVFIEDSATDPRMTTHVRSNFGPSLMLPLQAGGRLIGTLALPRRRGERAYTSVERLLATQFASQAALALVLADAQQSRQRLAVFEDRDRIARDLHDLVVQRLFATGMMLESTRSRDRSPQVESTLDQAVDELESTIQEVRTAIFALQQPPADAPTTFRGKVLRETAGAAAVVGVQPSVHFTGAVDARVTDPAAGHLLAALRRALATASRRPDVTRIEVAVDARATLPDGRTGVRLTVYDDGTTDGVGSGTTTTWQAPL
ncbi:GAF domain-containing protein [Streptomyces durmitorensis]|uniref:GAF domain-containing protein n=1 Tax=Streptomyces durmitorensis TaxID=319947 RepID=A0ABY4Q028_9ACTN|nr:GAF domain-containing protein [Streptomyces durmitorensis]UQT58714.1 GAF domain-containing protein [Streptomyces durmitorensis]